jgi:dipeptidyl aminopeptidase/acylaminoacyl peptidase
VRNFLSSITIAVIFVLIGWFANTAYHLPRDSNPIAQVKPTPLNKYTVENLSDADFKSGQILVGDIIKESPKFTSYKFSMQFSPDFSGNLKTTTGVINIPKGNGPFPVIAMFRGYVDQKEYTIGDGTQPSAKIFAENGFITVSPDFLGYGESSTEAADIFESRFQTYVTAATLINSIKSLNQWDQNNIFIWGHSNGGQIALTTLEITGVNYPTVLWAPVSKPFPASILTYIDEADDGGGLIISKLAEFMATYDVAKFSAPGYLDKINAPIQLNQGSTDTSVPYWWSDSLAKKLLGFGVDLDYVKYPGANHNMVPLWDKAVNNAILFYNKHIMR